MTEAAPLSGLKIVVTRPRAQAGQLVESIEKLGAQALQFPLLEIYPLTDKQPLSDVIARLHEFQLAIFISPNAVKFGMEAILKAGALPESLQIATIGPGSKQALLELGVKIVLAPTLSFDSESLLALPELNDVNNKYIVIFRGDRGRELLGDTLVKRGAMLEYAACYRRTGPQFDKKDLLIAQADIVTISSSEALQKLWDMLDAGERKYMTRIPLFVTHPRIAATAHELGYRNIITAGGSDENLLRALTSWAVQNRGIA